MSLYLMGLIPADQVVPLKWYLTSGSWSDKGIPCEEKTFSAEDVINLVGLRNPAYPNTQRDFSVAYILLTKQGQVPTSTQINKMNFMAENFPKEWAKATSYKSTINAAPISVQIPPATTTIPPVSVNSGPATYNFGSVTLRNGSRGEAVKELQRFLNQKLNLGLVIDGILGPKTIAVIKKWQMDNGLVPDGLIGPKTKAMMNSIAQ